MKCSFGHAGCQKTVAKNEIFHMIIGQNLKFVDTWELYTSKESLEHVEYKFKKKKYNFLIKNWFFEIFNFFPKGGPFDVKIVKSIFFDFSKIWKKRIPQMTFMGPFKHKKEQSQEFRVA